MAALRDLALTWTVTVLGGCGSPAGAKPTAPLAPLPDDEPLQLTDTPPAGRVDEHGMFWSDEAPFGVRWPAGAQFGRMQEGQQTTLIMFRNGMTAMLQYRNRENGEPVTQAGLDALLNQDWSDRRSVTVPGSELARCALNHIESNGPVVRLEQCVVANGRWLITVFSMRRDESERSEIMRSLVVIPDRR